MDPVAQPVADKNGDSTREKKKRGRPRKYRSGIPMEFLLSPQKRGRPIKYRSGIPMEFPLSPQPISLSPPPGFLDNYQVAASRIGILPVDNHTTPAKGLDMNVDDARHSVGSKNLGAVHKLAADGPSGVRDMTCSEYIKTVEKNKVSQIGGAKLAQYSSRKTAQHDRQCSSPKMNNVEPANTGPEHESMIKQDNEETVAGQAQRQMHQFSSAFTELCTSFETDKKKIKELEKQVTELEDQLRKWSDEKARWDDKEKELRRERDEARKEALEAASENKDLKEKIEMASKHVEDSKASEKKAIDEAVESYKKRHKICVGNFVAALAKGDGTSIEGYALELANEITPVDRAADDRAGYEDDEAMRLRRSQRSPMPNPKYE